MCTVKTFHQQLNYSVKKRKKNEENMTSKSNVNVKLHRSMYVGDGVKIYPLFRSCIQIQIRFSIATTKSEKSLLFLLWNKESTLQ